MESDKDYIKKTFASKFSNFEPDLPDSVWTRIEADLDKPFLTVVNKPKRNIIRKTIAAVVGAAAVIMIALFTLNEIIEPQDIASNVIVEDINSKIEDAKASTVKSQTEENDVALPASTKSLKSSLLASALPQAKMVNENLINEIEVAENKEQQESGVTDFVALNDVDNQLEVVEPSIDNSIDEFDKKLEEQIAAFAREGESLQQILADNSTSSIPQKKENLSFGVQAGSGFNKADDTKNKFNTGYNDVSNNGNIFLRTQRMRLQHDQPITFGLNVSKQISNKLSIETGITYAYLSSRMKADDKSDIQQSDRQYFNYFGVPLMLNYTLLEWRKLKVYTSLGGMIQKDFYGRISSSMYVEGLIGTEKDSKEKISQKNPQFSSSLTLGASYPIYKDIRVYGNFGGSYYFDAKNEYETIYSDKKWLFNLNVGLKFEF